MRKLVLRLALPVWAMTLGAPLTLAQSYPSKPIRIVTQEAGGGNDGLARLMATGMSGGLGQPIIVENRGGAGGVQQGENHDPLRPRDHRLVQETS